MGIQQQQALLGDRNLSPVRLILVGQQQQRHAKLLLCQISEGFFFIHAAAAAVDSDELVSHCLTPPPTSS